jgi:hypothetical protein
LRPKILPQNLHDTRVSAWKYQHTEAEEVFLVVFQYIEIQAIIKDAAKECRKTL